MRKGSKMSEEARARLKTAMSKPEVRAKQRASQSAAQSRPEVRARHSAAMMGRKASEETRLKMSISRKGRAVSAESRQKMSEAAKGKKPTSETRLKLSKSRMGNTNSLGHHHGLETRRKIGEASKHRVGNAERLRKMAGNTKGIPKSLLHRRKLALSHQGKMASPETCEKVKVAKRGVRFYNWLGGLSLEPYSPLWTEQLKHHIRVRDHFICQLCGLPQGTSTHAVHHIDYDKKNCADDNLITLCLRCHQRTNTRRNYWQRHFQEIMSAAQEASRTALEVQGQLC